MEFPSVIALCARYQKSKLNGWAVVVNNLIGLFTIVSLWLVIRLRVSRTGCDSYEWLLHANNRVVYLKPLASMCSQYLKPISLYRRSRTLCAISKFQFKRLGCDGEYINLIWLLAIESMWLLIQLRVLRTGCDSYEWFLNKNNTDYGCIRIIRVIIEWK